MQSTNMGAGDYQQVLSSSVAVGSWPKENDDSNHKGQQHVNEKAASVQRGEDHHQHDQTQVQSRTGSHAAKRNNLSLDIDRLDGILPALGEYKESHVRDTHFPESPPFSGKLEALNNKNNNNKNTKGWLSTLACQVNSATTPSTVDESHILQQAATSPTLHAHLALRHAAAVEEDAGGDTSYLLWCKKLNNSSITSTAICTSNKPQNISVVDVLQLPPPDVAAIGSHLNDKQQLKEVLHHLSPNENNHGKSTFFQATLNCVSLLYGLGILSSPYAVAKTGWMGVIISILVSTAYAYTAYLMARCVEFDPACSNYQDIAKLALGKRMRKIITVLFYMELTGTLVGYCISMGDNLNYIFPHVGFSLPGLSNRNLMICLVTLIILPSVWLRDLSALSFTSIWCIVSSLLLLVGVMLTATVNHIGFTHPLPFLHIKGVPVAAGLYAFSYGGTSVFPSIYKSMKDPSKFTQVLVVSFLIATASIAGLGVAGAYMFGEQTASQVTLSMPVHFITTKIVLWMTILTPIFKFALQLSPITTAVEVQLYKRCQNTQEAGKKALLFSISTLMRSSVLALIAIISMTLPYFEYIITLVGSSMTIGICMIFPCLFYLKLYWKRLPSLTIAFITFLIAIGLIVGACGTLTAFQGLVHSRSSHHSN